MYKICKTEQSAARQREIEQYLLKSMLQRQYNDISISELCDGLGIPRKAFYRYFSGKQGALEALIDHTLVDMDAYAFLQEHSSAAVSRNRKAEVFFHFWREQKEFLDAIEHCGLWEILMDRTTEYTLARLTQSQTPPVVPGEHDYLVRSAVYGVFAIIQLLYRRGFPMTAEEAADMSQFVFSQLSSQGSTTLAKGNTVNLIRDNPILPN